MGGCNKKRKRKRKKQRIKIVVVMHGCDSRGEERIESPLLVFPLLYSFCPLLFFTFLRENGGHLYLYLHLALSLERDELKEDKELK